MSIFALIIRLFVRNKRLPSESISGGFSEELFNAFVREGDVKPAIRRGK